MKLNFSGVQWHGRAARESGFDCMSPGGASMYCSPCYPLRSTLHPPPSSGSFAAMGSRVEDCSRQQRIGNGILREHRSASFFAASREKGNSPSALKSRSNFFQGHLSWKQVTKINPQHPCQKKKLTIRNATQPQFQLGQRMPGDGPALQLQLARHCFLRPTPAIAPLAHLRANQIQSGFHQWPAG